MLLLMLFVKSTLELLALLLEHILQHYDKLLKMMKLKLKAVIFAVIQKVKKYIERKVTTGRNAVQYFFCS